VIGGWLEERLADERDVPPAGPSRVHMPEGERELHHQRQKREVADLGPTPEQAHAWISARCDLGYYHKLGHKKDGRPAGR
jgi:hypothetical protein